MPDFKDINSLLKYIQKQMNATMKEEVAQEVKFEEQRQIQKIVYEAYPNPYAYDRRMYDDGGLQDLDMMVAVTEVRKNEVILSVVNMAKGQDEEDLYIAPLIEYGDGEGHGEYQYKFNRDHSSWRYLQSRPFTAETIDALRRSGKHIKAFKDGMRKRGIEIQ